MTKYANLSNAKEKTMSNNQANLTHDTKAFRRWAERVTRSGVSVDVIVLDYLLSDPEHYELRSQFTASGRPEVYPS